MTTKPSASPGLRLALDYAPLVVFLVFTFLVPAAPMRDLVARFTHTLDARPPAEALLIARVIVATVAFALATIATMIVSRLRFGHIAPMLWVTGVLVVVFGGLTVWFADPRFIKMKPTFVYALFAAALGYGVATGRPLLRQLLGTAYPGLDHAGWMKLTRNWAVFFAVMAGANEAVWRWTAAAMSDTAAFRAWTLYKFPGCAIITIGFAMANVPMLLRHGLTADAATDTIPPEA